MIKFRQHIPGFADGQDPAVYEASTIAELLEMPKIKSWTEDLGFFRFSKSPHIGQPTNLMAELHGGKEWWVVGYIWSDSYLDLPLWTTPEEDLGP